MGARRLARELARIFNLTLSPYTIRNILRRNNRKSKKVRSKNGNRRYYANLKHWEALQYIQTDAKHIVDAKALPKEVYPAIFKYKLLKHQFTAIDIRTRTRFLSFANGFSFMIYMGFILRALGVRHRQTMELSLEAAETGRGPSWKKTSRPR